MNSEFGDRDYWLEDKKNLYDFDQREAGREKEKLAAQSASESNIFENTTTKLPYLRDMYLKEKPTKQLVQYSAVVNGEVSSD